MKLKRITLFALAAMMVLSLAACDVDGDGTQSGVAANGSATPASEAAKPAQGEGNIGDYHIKIVSAQKGKDYQDKDVLIVTYEWTNNSDEEQMFSTAFGTTAYQDGVECSSAFSVDGVDAQKSLSKIKPGASLEVKDAYVLNDTTTDVQVEVGPWVDLGGGDKVTKTFSIK